MSLFFLSLFSLDAVSCFIFLSLLLQSLIFRSFLPSLPPSPPSTYPCEDMLHTQIQSQKKPTPARLPSLPPSLPPSFPPPSPTLHCLDLFRHCQHCALLLSQPWLASPQEASHKEITEQIQITPIHQGTRIHILTFHLTMLGVGVQEVEGGGADADAHDHL